MIAITTTAIAIFGLFLFHSNSTASLDSDVNYTYISGLRWHNTYEAGHKVALEMEKPMLVYAWATWCKYCQKLHAQVFPNPMVSKFLEKDFVLVAVNLDKNREDADRFEIQYPPHFLFLASDGEKVLEAQGFRSIEELSGILEQVTIRQARIEHGYNLNNFSISEELTY